MKRRTKIIQNSLIRERNKFKFKLDFFKILSIVLLVSFVFFIPFLVRKQIKITKIECISQHGSCPSDLSSDLSNYVGFDLGRTKKSLEDYLSQSILINDFLIQFKIPSTLQVEVNIKKPKSALYLKENNVYYLIDKDGVIVDITHESNLPSLEILNTDLKLGETIQEKDLFAINLINNLSFLYSINSGVIENNILKVKSSEGVVILFPLEGEVDFLIGSIRIIFSRLNDESEGIRMEDVREIDLRFKNPIIR